MSTSTPGHGQGGAAGPGGGQRPPFDPVRRPATSGSAAAGAARQTAHPSAHPSARPSARRRRPPVWLLILAGLLVAGLGVVAVLMVTNRGGGLVPEAEVITLPVPTPTVEAAPREPGTAFSDALPSVVREFAVTAVAADPTFLAAGALESHRADYTDGTRALVLLAGQWPTSQEATVAADATVAAQVAAAGEVEGSPVEEGVVEVDGTTVGAWTLVPRADGTATLTWTNGTAVLVMDGPAEALPDVFAAFPL